MKRLVLSTLLAGMAVGAAWAQSSAAAASPAAPATSTAHAACPAPQALEAADLVGDWTVSWQSHRMDAPAAATNPASTNLPPTTSIAPSGPPPANGQIQFQRNPDYPESLVGVMFQGQVKHLLAGDVDEGLLTLEESTDGQHISANWVGHFQARDCGRSVSGNWISATGNQQWAFTLRRSAAW